jgi:Bardet-Biedl syndrome 2 protein
MKSAFKFELGSDISPGQVTVGRFDGKHPSLAAATTTGKLVLHSPHQNAQYQEESREIQGAVRHLKINNRVTAVAAACLEPSSENPADSLIIGTETTLQAYNVEENRDLFFVEVDDGISTIVCGHLSGMGEEDDRSSGGEKTNHDGSMVPPTVFAGGDLSVHGFNCTGKEVFWTVTGGNIGAMTLVDINGNGEKELLVGSDDYEIRTFRGEEVIGETTETAAVSHLVPLKEGKPMFAYGLTNGTLGVYNGNSSRVWRMKSKNQLLSVESFDIDGDGVNEVCSGWSNGKFEVRRDRDGSVVFKDRLESGVAGLVVGDYRLDGSEQIVVCSQSGEVRGYLPFEGQVGTSILKEKEEDVAVNELLTEKQNLLMQLRGIEGNVKQLKSGEPLGAGVIDPNTKVHLEIVVNRRQRCIDLELSTNNETVVRCAVTYNLEGGILNGESYVVHPSTPSKILKVPLRPQKDVETKLDIHAMVGARGNSSQYHVFELEANLPKFSTLVGDSEASAVNGSRSRRIKESRTNANIGKCVFYINERVDRVHQWASQAFLGLGDGKTGPLRGGKNSLRPPPPRAVSL